MKRSALFPPDPGGRKPASMPAQKPHRSRQDYETPDDFLAAVYRRFGRVDVDLAARVDNAKAPRFVTPEEDSLSLPWGDLFEGLVCWLNPPFGDIDPWAEKCAAERARVLMLTPASVGANWFADHVHGRAKVLGLSPRLQFLGADDPYPKDCILSCFGDPPGFDVWRWR